ncbi:FAR1-related protein [Sesbania bispinosa]|nr:FAR1-related protein [Sesbania bispinosa]
MANFEFESNINLDDDKDPVFHYIPKSDHFVGGEQGEIGVGPKKEETGLRDDQASFTRKDMYNYPHRKNQAKIKKGDVRVGLRYLQAKADGDPLLHWKYSTRLDDETTETYKWVLEAFLDAMGNKQPKAVVTDGDNAIAMHSNFTQEKFEDYWKKMMVEHGLVGNKWVSKTYENKELWATAYLRDKFFGHIRTTSQYESINSFIRLYCKKKSSMVEFLHKFEQAKKEYRNNELMVEFKTLFSESVLTTYLRSIEKEIDFMSHYGEDEIDSDVMEEACYASISAACNNFAKVASKKRNYLKEILEEIQNLTIKYEKLGDKVCTDGNPTVQHVGDPNVEKDAMDTIEANEEETNLDHIMNDDKNSQERDGQQKHVQFDCTRHNVDKGKDKIRSLSKKKEKSTGQEKKLKHAKEPVRMIINFHYDIEL